VILPALPHHSLGSHEDENRISASCSKFSTRPAQSGPTHRACRTRPAYVVINLRGSTGESPFADDRYSWFLFSSLDDLHCKRADSYVGHPVDYPSISSRTLCVSGPAHLHVPDDHLHFCYVDHLLSELVHNDAVLLSEAKHLGLFSSGKWVQKLIRDSSPAIAGSE
jgi:hypothetical protein